MATPARRFSLFSVLLAAVALATATLAPGLDAKAQSLYNQPKYAAIVVDAPTSPAIRPPSPRS